MAWKWMVMIFVYTQSACANTCFSAGGTALRPCYPRRISFALQAPWSPRARTGASTPSSGLGLTTGRCLGSSRSRSCS